MINQKLHDFLNGMSDTNKHRFITFAKGFEMFAVEPDLGTTDDITIVFINDETIVKFDNKDSMYTINTDDRSAWSLINTNSTHNLERGIYKVKELPYFDMDLYKEELEKSRNLTFSKIHDLPVIETTYQLYDFFNAINKNVSFYDHDLSELAYQDDKRFNIETVFKIEGSYDGKGSHSIKRIKFDNELAFYASYNGKYGDEPTTFIVNESAYRKLLQYVESKYSSQKFEVYSDDSLIFKNLGSRFYDFVEEHHKSPETISEE